MYEIILKNQDNIFGATFNVKELDNKRVIVAKPRSH
jgi:hypothetical protein